MRFYQVHMTHEAGTSIGFEYYTTRPAADKAAAEYLFDYPEESAEVTAIDVEPTKAGILRALNQYAGHPDNG